MGFLFTSESVSEGHPDKVSDQISDAILDEFLRHDANSKVACETLCTTGLVVVAGEVRSERLRRRPGRNAPRHQPHRLHPKRIPVRRQFVRRTLGDPRTVVRTSTRASCARPKRSRARATRASCSAMRATKRANTCLRRSSSRTSFSRNWPSSAAKVQVMTYLRPDAEVAGNDRIRRSRRTVRCAYIPIVVSTQHDDFIPTSKGVTEKDGREAHAGEDPRGRAHDPHSARQGPSGTRRAISWRRLIGDDYILHVNPTGKFVIGGPHGDTGLTGRKIIVDTYGGTRCPRRRRLLGQGLLEGGPFGSLRRPLHRQEHGGGRASRTKFSWS